MVRFKLCVKCRAAGDRDRTVKTAATLGREPAFERVTGLDRNIPWRGRPAVRLDGFREAALAVDRAAVCACIPLNCQADGRAAVVTLAVTVRVGVVSVFIAGIAAGRARLGALMLRFRCV